MSDFEKLRIDVNSLFKKSINFVLSFYLKEVFLIFLFLSFILCLFKINLWLFFGITYITNLLIALSTQWLHKERFLSTLKESNHLKQDDTPHNQLSEYKKFIYENQKDCNLRCSAGTIEFIFYSVFFAIQIPELIVGYLVLKTISIWRNTDSKKEGLSTAVLRIAVVTSLIFSLLASYFLSPVLKMFFNFQ